MDTRRKISQRFSFGRQIKLRDKKSPRQTGAFRIPHEQGKIINHPRKKP